MARIGIDGRFYGSIGKGLGRYTQKLIEHLEEIDSENQYFVFLKRENFDEYAPKNQNFKKIVADYQWYSFSEQLFFPKLLNQYGLDLMHFPHFNVPILYFRKFVITIHDLILVHFPTKRASTLSPVWYWIKYLAYKLVIYSAVFRSHKIFAVSQFTKNDILSQYSVNEDKIAVTYEACEKMPKTGPETPEKILEKYGIIKPYLLYVGNAYPHKNLEQLIEAFTEISDKIKGMNLVLVGKNDYFYSRLKSEAEKKQVPGVLFPGFVSDEDLKIVYEQSVLYVFPSLYEGFGLPPLEAMEAGVPVLCADSTCLPEILGEGAFFFEAGKRSALSEAIVRVASEKKLRESLIAKGFEQINKYSWQKMADQTLETYNKIVQ